MALNHQVVPAFWAPIPTKSGGPVISSSRAGGGVGSKPSSHGAYLLNAWRIDRLAGAGNLAKTGTAIRRMPHASSRSFSPFRAVVITLAISRDQPQPLLC